MRTPSIDSSVFIKNRERFIKNLPPKSIAIFNSNDLMPKNADQVMRFKQNSDLFHLCGINQEETILIIIAGNTLQEKEEILFIKETNDIIKVWEGNKFSKDDAKKIAGVKVVFWNTDFEKTIDNIMQKGKVVYLNSNEHPRANIVVESRDERFKKWIKKRYPNHAYKKAANILYPIRAVKQPAEVALIQRACDITHGGVKRVLKCLKPGVYEYELEAEIIRDFLLNKSTGFAYDPIIASGSNACILHYATNNDICNDGDIVLMDFGAEYANYASDLTRCFPVNGKFTTRQKDVYNSVLRVMIGAKKLLKPGVFLSEYEKNVGTLMEKELVDLGLLSIKEIGKFEESPAYKKYYMHGTSHHLGLDVHDVCDSTKPLSGGMVITCEPGIYIPEENLGIRLENDILITESGTTDLMEKIPIDSEEIEDLLNI